LLVGISTWHNLVSPWTQERRLHQQMESNVYNSFLYKIELVFRLTFVLYISFHEYQNQDYHPWKEPSASTRTEEYIRVKSSHPYD
jgi:hypothetical protein